MNKYSADLLEVVRELADVDPVVMETDWYSACLFCGAGSNVEADLERCYHAEDCTWATARRLLGLPAATVADHPGPVHGPPKPRSLMTGLEAALYDHEQALIRQLSRPTVLDELQRGYNADRERARSNFKQQRVTFNIGRSTK